MVLSAGTCWRIEFAHAGFPRRDSRLASITSDDLQREKSHATDKSDNPGGDKSG